MSILVKDNADLSLNNKPIASFCVQGIKSETISSLQRYHILFIVDICYTPSNKCIVLYICIIEVLCMNTKSILLSAMHDIMLEKPFAQITVQDILDRSGVSRGTFYKYYQDKYELANSYLSNYITTEIFPAYDGTNQTELIHQIIDFVYSHKAYFQALTNDINVDSFRGTFLHFCLDAYTKVYMYNQNRNTLTTLEKMRLELFTSGQIYLFAKWVHDGCKQNPKEFGKNLLELTPHEYIYVQRKERTNP